MLEPRTATTAMQKGAMPRTKADYIGKLEMAYMEGCLDTIAAIKGEENRRLEAEYERDCEQKRLTKLRIIILSVLAIALFLVFQPDFSFLFKPIC